MGKGQEFAQAQVQDDNNLIFVLDIGTRNIIGIAGHDEGGLFHVEACERMEHPRRAMIDGQIEDIPQVALVAGQVKRRIEEKLGYPLTRVSVAAAGRALKTIRTTWSGQLPTGPITAKMVYEMENNAVNEARTSLDTAGEQVPYTCVGHSVVRYALDDYPFSTVVGHRGSRIDIEIIATFLPTEVVGSLRQCMDLLDLEIDTLTLEPIAAMRAVIPPDVRLLNLALADIGAGTSDIALSADGTVAGYTMATTAGDEITESIIKKYLVDFETAEHIKLSCGKGEPITFTDILGFEQSITDGDVMDTISDAVDLLAKVIADKIVDCNGGPPAAVFLVGGGSETPGLPRRLAEILGLEPNKVSAGGTRFAGRILTGDVPVEGPEYATPVGIALVAVENAANEGASVTINGKRVRLFSGKPGSIMDTLLVAGYNYSDLMGRNGRSLTFTLNGVRTVVRGGLYSAAEITLDGSPASLSDLVDNGAEITITPAASGEDAFASIGGYAEGDSQIVVTLNGRSATAGLVAFINGAPVGPEQEIVNGDEVEIFHLRTAGEFCAAAGVSALGGDLLVNGTPVAPDAVLQDGDDIVVEGAVSQSLFTAPEPAAPPPAPTAEAPLAPEPEAREPAPETGGDTPEDAAPAADLPAPEEQAPEAEAPDAAAPPAEPEQKAPERFPENRSVFNKMEQPPAPVAESAPPVVDKDELPAPPAEKAAIPESAPQTAAPPAPEPEPKQEPEPEQPTAPEQPMLPKENSAAQTPAPDPAPPTARPAASLPTGGAQPQKAAHRSIPGAPRGPLRIELNGRTLMLPPKAGGDAHMLLEMLPLVDIDPGNPRGPVVIRLNGQDAAYTDELASGDSVEIHWKED